MMRLPDAQTNGLTVSQFEDQLKQRGYRRLNFGAFANVYARNNEPEVIKVGNDVNGDGYLQFLRHVGLRSKNPHFPRIESLEIFDNEPNNPYSCPYYVVRMERLRERTQIGYRQALAQFGINEVGDLLEPLNITARTRHALKVKEILARLFTQYAADIKSSNVMWRINADNTVDMVVTDPVACYVGEDIDE